MIGGKENIEKWGRKINNLLSHRSKIPTVNVLASFPRILSTLKVWNCEHLVYILLNNRDTF